MIINKNVWEILKEVVKGQATQIDIQNEIILCQQKTIESLQNKISSNQDIQIPVNF